MLYHESSDCNKNHRKSTISKLFAPTPKTFDDQHREWHELKAQEAATLVIGKRHAIARRRTEIVESFPAWERPAVLDRLNKPLPTIESLFEKDYRYAVN